MVEITAYIRKQRLCDSGKELLAPNEQEMGTQRWFVQRCDFQRWRNSKLESSALQGWLQQDHAMGVSVAPVELQTSLDFFLSPTFGVSYPTPVSCLGFSNIWSYPSLDNVLHNTVPGNLLFSLG
jgi:hypothetical protein